MRAISRLYRALLVIAPAPLRETHGAEMAELFDERVVAASARGVFAVVGVCASAALDLLAARTKSGQGQRLLPLSIPIEEGTGFMLGSDVRYAWRALRHQRGSTAMVVLMLALGIAANITVFSLVNGLFLRPFPFARPDRLVYINTVAPKWNLEVVGINYPDFARWRKDQKLFEAISAFQTDFFNLSDAGGAEHVRGAFITYDFPKVLGVEPILGRTFTADEDKPHGPPVVLISAALWKERFAEDRSVVGRSLRIDGVSRTIVGVMPAEASFPEDARLWLPLGGDPAAPYQSYSGDGIGRLKPGVTIEQADADLKRAHQPIWDAQDKEHIVTPFVRSLREMFVHDYRGAAKTITAFVAVLLIIACANVAAVMLARALARRREMGIRLALGSSRMRLLRQLLIENLMLSAAGGLLGLVAGRWALGALVRMIPDELPRWAAFQVDFRVLAFSFAVVIGAVVLFGWAPALHAVGGDLRSAVNATTNGTTGAPRARRTLWCLVAGEFALAAILLVCGTLLVKAFDRVRHVDPGFRSDHVLVATIPLSEGTRPKPEQWTAFWDEFEQRASHLPGVDAAGLITCAPISGCHLGNFFQAEGAVPRPDGKDPVVLTRFASNGYFGAMGIRLKSGRFLQEPDGRPKQTGTVVVNESFVRAFWGDHVDPVGKRIKFRRQGRALVDRGRPRRRREALRARATDAARRIPAAPRRSAIEHDHGRPYDWRYGLGGAGASRAAAPDGSRDSLVSRPDDGAGNQSIDGASRGVLLDVGDLRDACVPARDRRRLRRGHLSRDPTHARDRYSRGARRRDVRHLPQRCRERDHRCGHRRRAGTGRLCGRDAVAWLGALRCQRSRHRGALLRDDHPAGHGVDR